MNKLSLYHPFVVFLYFIAMIVITMFSINPIVMAVSFLSSVALCFILFPLKEMVKSIAYSLIFMLVIALSNPLFVHKGVTELFFLNNQAVTLEAITYGVTLAFMLGSVYYWFKAYNHIVTSDKFLYLFGKITPKFALMLSISLAFLPKLKMQYHEIRDSQQAMGIFGGDGFIDRIKNRLRIVSILFTYSIESSIDTANSMQARGYGLKNRTYFGFYNWRKYDTVYIIFILLALSVIFTLLAKGFGNFSFYPTFSKLVGSKETILLYCFVVIFAFSPLFIETKENIVWRLLQSKI